MVCNSAANINRNALPFCVKDMDSSMPVNQKLNVNSAGVQWQCSNIGIIDQIHGPIPNDAKFENWPANPDINQFWTNKTTWKILH
jgi:hypothetical protein